MRHLIDLSHPIESGAPGYPGLPVARVEPWLSHAASRDRYQHLAEFEITRLFMVGNTGTYLDSPYHRFEDAPDVAAMPLEALAGLALVCLSAADRPGPVTLELPPDVRGAALVVRTGWDRHRGTPAYWQPGPFIDRAGAERIAAAGPALVGVDFWNVDDTTDPARPAHTILLGARIPIVEHLAHLDLVPPTGARFWAVPAPIRGAASMPVRAFAELPGEGV